MTEAILIVVGLAAVLVVDLLAISARAAFLQTSHARLLAQRDAVGERAGAAIQLNSALPRTRAALNATLVFTRFLLAGLVLLLVGQRVILRPEVVGALALLVGALLIFWFEWAVERSALRSPEAVAIRTAPFVRILIAITGILTLPLGLSAAAPSGSDEANAGLEDELKTLVDAGEEEGVFETEERKMFYSIFELGDTLAREIMVPRIDMLSLEVNTPLVDAVDALLQAGYSRVPVYEDSVDNTLGLLYAKDLLRAWREEKRTASLRGLLRQAYFVPEGKRVNELLAEMQSQRIHIAIVVDEYGGVAGLVTLEDIIEEIFGEIRDEFDQGEEAPYQKLADGSYVFLGRIGLDDFNEIMGSTLTSIDTDTLGGYIYGCLGHVPHTGETIRESNLLLTVEHVSGRRIHKVSARWSHPAELKDEEIEGA